jgi:hypothetical protein
MPAFSISPYGRASRRPRLRLRSISAANSLPGAAIVDDAQRIQAQVAVDRMVVIGGPFVAVVVQIAAPHRAPVIAVFQLIALPEQMQVIASQQRRRVSQCHPGGGQAGGGAAEIGGGLRAAVAVAVAQIFQAQALAVFQRARGAEQGDGFPRGFGLQAERQQRIGG